MVGRGGIFNKGTFHNLDRGDIRIETPDKNEAKELLKFCRKFTVPLRQALRGNQMLTARDTDRIPVMHVCFIEPGHCYVGYSYTKTYLL